MLFVVGKRLAVKVVVVVVVVARAAVVVLALVTFARLLVEPTLELLRLGMTFVTLDDGDVKLTFTPGEFRPSQEFEDVLVKRMLLLLLLIVLLLAMATSF